MEWLGQLIPKIIIVRATHGGVKFVRGKRIKCLNPGMHVYWPITTEVEIIATARQTMNLATQVLVTKDQYSVAAGAVVVYRIDQVESALSDNWDVEDTIIDIAQAAIVKTITSMPLGELICEITNRVENELSKEVRKKLKPFGVAVERCALTDFSQCFVLKTLGDKS